MKKEAVIFDLDGTLLNTIDDLADSMNRTLRENGFPEQNRDNYYYFVGNGARKLVERALPEDKRDDESVERYLKRYREIYAGTWNVKTHLYKGVFPLLKALKEKGIPIAILSNKPHSDVVKVVEYYFETGLFSSYAGQKDHIPHKPSPEGVFHLVRELGVEPADCLFVGDSSVDMKTAKASGMSAVGVSWGFRTREELLESGADFIIDEPDQLLSLLD